MARLGRRQPFPPKFKRPDLGPVYLDNLSRSAYTSLSATVSCTHVVGTNSNRLLVVAVSVMLSQSVTGITAGGVALTKIRHDANGGYRSELWYLIAPASGSQTVTVTLSSAINTTQFEVVSYWNVHQTSPIDANNGATGTSSTASASVTTVTANDRVIGVVTAATTSGALTNEIGQVSRGTDWGGQGQGFAAEKGSVITPASTTLQWNGLGGSDAWSVSLAAIRPIAVSGDTTTAQTITGVARIEKSVSQTITGVGRVQKSVSTTITGHSRIQQSVSQTITGLARIQNSATQTITGTGRVQTSVSQTSTGTARIQKSTAQTITGVGRIQKSITSTITGVARIQRVESELSTISGQASIQKTTTQTIAGVATITGGTTQNITGTGRVTASTTKTTTGVARIQKSATKTITGVASITASATTAQTITGVASIFNPNVSQTITGVARIQRQSWYEDNPTPFEAAASSGWYTDNPQSYKTNASSAWYDVASNTWKTEDF